MENETKTPIGQDEKSTDNSEESKLLAMLEAKSQEVDRKIEDLNLKQREFEAKIRAKQLAGQSYGGTIGTETQEQREQAQLDAVNEYAKAVGYKFKKEDIQ